MSAGDLPEVIRLVDARGPRPDGAVGAGGFWYDPGVWNLPISPAARVLYVSLCSFLGRGEADRHDLRAALKDSSDRELSTTLGELVDHGLLSSLTPVRGDRPGYEVRPVNSGG
jgi:hypothetical protein